MFQYGSEFSAYSLVFSLFTPARGFFNFPSRYFYSIGLLLIFSLRCFHHLFALHYQAALLVPCAFARGCHPLWPRFPSGSLLPRHNARKLTIGALSCSVAPTKEIRVRFFSYPY